MAKPTDLPRWDDVTGANRLEPTSGLKDTGWVAGQRPAAKHVNWLLYTLYSWILYVSALLGGAGVSETLKAAGIDTTGNSTVGGTLGVTGLATVGGTLGVTGVVTGAEYKFGTTRTRVVGAQAGNNDAGDNYALSAGLPRSVVNTSAGGAWYIPIEVESGETITVKLRCKHSVAGAGEIQAILYAYQGATVNLTSATASSAASTAEQSVTVQSAHAVLSANRYFLHVFNGGGGAMTRTLYDVVVEYTRP